MLAMSAGSATGAGAPLPHEVENRVGRPASIAVSYADLIDTATLTRTGRKLGDALHDSRTPRAQLQAFLDGYSSLLPYVVEMVFGADPAPRRDILERWPAGSPQPAWVALFRGGKYHAVADHAGRVRLFLPGDDAATAWRKHYSVVRHCLAALASTGGLPVTAEIFAYRNDYRKQELRLSLRPVTVAGTEFPPERSDLDLTSLGDFFSQGGQLEGAQIDPDEGLVLFANPDRRNTLAGEPLTLADLAVAYRAAFHAGDNAAFVSLDPNVDSGAVSVNFGGFLEDTRIGATVLAADRRFKTVCSGLDPLTHRDVRQEIRKVVPTFMTNSERAFLMDGAAGTQGWIMTRYWFYPESVSVDADPLEGFAVITRPQFTADAERIGKGFDDVGSRRKRTALDPGIRENIRDINANYARYAAAFPEFGDLTAVARLMAISTWLKRFEATRLDLDALLAVELPALSTPRALERVISTEYLAVPPDVKVSETMVRERSEVTWLTPLLQRKVGDFFGNQKTFTAYLCVARKAKRRPCSDYETEAAALFEAQRDHPLRSLFREGGDLTIFLEFLVSRIDYPLPPEGEAERAKQLADEKRLGKIQEEMAHVAKQLRAAGEPPPEPLASERTRLEAETAAIMKRYHEARAEAASWRTNSRVQVSGGISLRPDDFTIRQAPGSPALKKFKLLAQGAAGGAVTAGGDARLVRSRPTGKVPRVAVKGAAASSPTAPASTVPRAQKGKESHAEITVPVPVTEAVTARVPSLVVTKIAIPAGIAGAAQALGELGADGRIVFRKISR